MLKFVQTIFIGYLLLSQSVFAQISFGTTENSNTGGTNPNQGMSPKEFKTTTADAAKKVADKLMQELQQQLSTYRAQHPVGSMPSGSAPPPPDPTPTATSPVAAPPSTSVLNAPASTSSTYTGFGTSQPSAPPQANPLYKPAAPATAPKSGLGVRY